MFLHHREVYITINLTFRTTEQKAFHCVWLSLYIITYATSHHLHREYQSPITLPRHGQSLLTCMPFLRPALPQSNLNEITNLTFENTSQMMSQLSQNPAVAPHLTQRNVNVLTSVYETLNILAVATSLT